jgi:predicted nucleic acid-binding protein
MRQGEAVFVDSGAWIALALSRDPLHVQAREQWELLHGAGEASHLRSRFHRDIHIS